MKWRASSAFTIAELIIIIIVIGILAASVLVGYNGWQHSSRESQVKSELIHAAAAMQDYSTYNDTYPSTVPADRYTPNSEVTITVANNSSVAYCLNGVSTVISSITYYMASDLKDPKPGTCSSWNGGGALAAPSNITTSWSSNTLTVSWTAASPTTNITNYSVECATDQGYQVNFLTKNVAVGTNQATFTASNVSYFCRVRSTGAGLPSPWATN